MNKVVIPVEVFDDVAEQIKRIDEAMAHIDAGSLKRTAIVTLLARTTKESRSSIENVLWGLNDLRRQYLKEKSND